MIYKVLPNTKKDYKAEKAANMHAVLQTFGTQGRAWCILSWLTRILSCVYPACASAANSSVMCSGPRVSMVMSMAVSPRFTP